MKMISWLGALIATAHVKTETSAHYAYRHLTKLNHGNYQVQRNKAYTVLLVHASATHKGQHVELNQYSNLIITTPSLSGRAYDLSCDKHPEICKIELNHDKIPATPVIIIHVEGMASKKLKDITSIMSVLETMVGDANVATFSSIDVIEERLGNDKVVPVAVLVGPHVNLNFRLLSFNYFPNIIDFYHITDTAIVKKYTGTALGASETPCLLMFTKGKFKEILKSVTDATKEGYSLLESSINSYAETFNANRAIKKPKMQPWNNQAVPNLTVESYRSCISNNNISVIVFSNDKLDSESISTLQILSKSKIIFNVCQVNPSVETAWVNTYGYDGSNNLLVLRPNRKKYYWTSVEFAASIVEAIEGGVRWNSFEGDQPSVVSRWAQSEL